MAAVTVSRSQDRLIAVKQVSAARAAEIDREAELLKRLDHPGLVRFVDLVKTDDGGRALHTEFVSSDTWATRPLTDPAERAAALASVAGIVADLHHLGVAHLQLSAGHVLHGEDDRPVLCGLTRAGEASPQNRQADLAALAELCHDQGLDRGAVTDKLESLADEARAGRLGARELAGRLDLLAVRRPAGPAPIRAATGGLLERARTRFSRKSLATVAAVAGAALVAFLLGSMIRGQQPPPATPSLESVGAGSDTNTGSGQPAPQPQGAVFATGNGVREAPLDTSDAASAPETVVDTGPTHPRNPTRAGNPAPDAVSAHAAAAVLEHGGRRYAVGATGDFVATGDWNCDGEATAAIVRPSTGGVVVFDAWPSPGQTIALPVRWTVDSPTGAQAVTHGQCDLLRVFTTAGSRLFDAAGR